MKFGEHINRKATKANQSLGLIFRTFTYMDKEMFLNLFKSLIRPHVEYATVVWSPVYKKDMIQIENVNGEPGLVDRVLALHVGSRGFDSHRGHISEDFSDPIDQDIRTQ